MPGGPEEIRVVVPYRTIANVLKLCESAAGEPVEFAEDEDRLFFSVRTRTMGGRKWAGRGFPPYEKIMRPTHRETIRVPRKRLADVLARVARFSDTNNQAVRIKVREKQIELSWSDMGDSEDRIDVERERSENFTVGLSGQYLLKFLQAENVEHFEIRMETPSDSIEFAPVDVDGYTVRYLVMPMKI